MFQYSGDRKVDLAYPPPALTANQSGSWELETDHEPKWELGCEKAFLSIKATELPPGPSHFPTARVTWPRSGA